MCANQSVLGLQNLLATEACFLSAWFNWSDSYVGVKGRRVANNKQLDTYPWNANLSFCGNVMCQHRLLSRDTSITCTDTVSVKVRRENKLEASR